MSDPESKNQGKGFKGLQSLGSKSSEPPALPERKADTPALPPAWEETNVQQAAQPQLIQSQTAASPWRGWVIGLGILGAIILFFVWAANQSSSSSSYSAQASTNYSSIESEPAPAEPPPGPTITVPPVGNGLVLRGDQIRYCVYEDRRIKGAERVVNNYNQTSVSTFNAMVDDYNSRCGYFQYREGTLTPIQVEADQIQEQLEKEGRQRMTPAHSYDTGTVDAASAADAAAIIETGDGASRDFPNVSGTYDVSSSTIYDPIVVTVSTETSVSVDVSINVRLIYQDGQVAGEQTETIFAQDLGTTEITFAKASPWPSGRYMVSVALNGEEIDSGRFVEMQ